MSNAITFKWKEKRFVVYAPDDEFYVRQLAEALLCDEEVILVNEGAYRSISISMSMYETQTTRIILDKYIEPIDFDSYEYRDTSPKNPKTTKHSPYKQFRKSVIKPNQPIKRVMRSVNRNR